MKIIKFVLRTVIGYLFSIPFVISLHLLSFFYGRKRAAYIVGNLLSAIAEKMASIPVPKIKRPEEFETFKKKIRRNFSFYAPLYDVEVANETTSKIEFRITNCPFTTAFIKLGAPDICSYICAGDWKNAIKNRDKWNFVRQHTIGTGSEYCNHTYIKIN